MISRLCNINHHLYKETNIIVLLFISIESISRIISLDWMYQMFYHFLLNGHDYQRERISSSSDDIDYSLKRIVIKKLNVSIMVVQTNERVP